MKKYQVFISSTYEDLKEERKEIIYSLMEADYIPVGMEFFMAASKPSWEVIQKRMDISDIYVLIIGFRYGTLVDGEQISYTEREYNYAQEIGLPVLAFIQDRNAPVSQSKREEKYPKKLKTFIERVEKNQVHYWENIHKLEGSLLKSLTGEINNSSKEKLGWYRFERKTFHVAKNHTTKYVFINALPNNTSSGMKACAENEEQYQGKFHEGENVLYWDFIKESGCKGKIETEHIGIFKEFIKQKKSELEGIPYVCLFYAGPSGLAFHMGCLFANGFSKIEIIQKTDSGYNSFGILEK